MNSGQTFGVDWPLLLGQIALFFVVFAVFIGLAIHATRRRVLRQYAVTRDEARSIMWLAVIWMVPGLGPLFTMSAADTFSCYERTRDFQRAVATLCSFLTAVTIRDYILAAWILFAVSG